MDTIKELKDMVESTLIHSQEYPFDHLELDELMNTWIKNKTTYINKFNGLIYKSPKKITIELTKAAKERMFDSMLIALNRVIDLTSAADNDVTIEKFLEDNKDGFFENRVVCSYPEIKISKGMKLLKCFKYFLPSFTVTRAAQDLASRFIQDTRVIEGYLYISVHPLDYLALSENTKNWRSCHSLDGCYRAGNLSYMTDSTTVVVYLTNKDDDLVQMRALPDGLLWHDKKWRMLLHTDGFNNIVYYDRPYPFDSDDLMKEVNFLVEKFSENLTLPTQNGFSAVKFSNRHTAVHLNHNFILGSRDYIYDTEDIIDDSDFLGYCDLIYSPFYVPITSCDKDLALSFKDGSFKTKAEFDKHFHNVYNIKIGGKVPCVRCGQNYVNRTYSFLCDDCIAIEGADDDYYFVCQTCGSRIYSKEEACYIHGEVVCQACADALNEEREGDI